MIKSKKGFTLIELLATIAIVSLILVVAGGFVLNVIKNSKDTTRVLTESSIKKTANTYVKEWPEEVVWNDDKDGEQYACVVVSLLVEKGYFDKTKLSDENTSDFIKIVRDSNNNIVSEEFVEPEVCNGVVTRIPIPKSEDICNDLEYNGPYSDTDTGIDLIDYEAGHMGYNYYDPISGGVPKGKDAGNYPVTLKLKDNYIWSDGTVEDKNVVCTIDKKTPTLTLDPEEAPAIGVGSYVIFVNSSISGKVSLKISDTKYVTASLKDGANITEGNIEANKELEIFINTLAGRTTDTYVTITVTPNKANSKNYYSTSIVHTISINKKKGDLKVVKIPTKESACKTNVIYNTKSQVMTKDPPAGYTYYNNTHKAINAGEHKVIAKLKSGYKWTNETLRNKEFYCSIGKRATDIQLIQSKSTISGLVGSVIKTQNIDVAKIRGFYKLGSDVKNITGTIEIVPTKYVGVSSLKHHKNYNAKSNSYYKATLNGLEVGTKKEFTVKFTPNDTSNFKPIEKKYTLTIRTNEYNLKYNTTKNGGTEECSPKSKKIYYNQKYGEMCVPKRKGYKFLGWYTKYDSRDEKYKITKDDIFKQEKDVTVYAHYRSKDSVKVTFVQFDGTTKKTTEKSGYKYNNDKSIKIKMPTPTSYKNSNECGTWSTLGWSKGTSATSSVDYSSGSSYTFTKDLTVYARYRKKVSFIYDYNGGDYIPSRHETSNRNASSLDAKSNVGPWTEKVDVDAHRSGYTFVGWYKGSDRVLKPGESGSFKFHCSDVMISANWQ